MDAKEKKTGVMLVTVSYVLWGCLPVFWKTLEDVPSVYVLCARVVWSLVFSAGYLTVKKDWGSIGRIWKDKRTVFRCALGGPVVCINWGS